MNKSIEHLFPILERWGWELVVVDRFTEMWIKHNKNGNPLAEEGDDEWWQDVELAEEFYKVFIGGEIIL